jgi:8-oxo-dGTP diphosphatase
MATSTSTPTIAPDAGCASGGAPGVSLFARNVRLRPLTQADTGALARLGDDPDIAGQLAEPIASFHPGPEHPFAFGVERLRDGALIGFIELRREGDRGEVTLWLGHDHWGKGYATESVSRLSRHGFQSLSVREIRARVLPANAASARVFAKAGFAEGGTAACGPHQARSFALTRDAWEARHTARPLVLVAAAALVDADGRVLIARRPEGKDMAGLWEFPGGKMRAGETPEAALIRELAEELSVDTRESCLAAVACASHNYDEFHLLMPVFACRVWKGAPTAREGQELRWVAPARLADWPMPPADAPLVSLLRDLL